MCCNNCCLSVAFMSITLEMFVRNFKFYTCMDLCIVAIDTNNLDSIQNIPNVAAPFALFAIFISVHCEMCLL